MGTTRGGGSTPGSSIRTEKFFVANPVDTAATINRALGSGMNLILTPEVYNLDHSIGVTRPDTVVLGLGFPTLIPENGTVSMTVANAKGMLISWWFAAALVAPFVSGGVVVGSGIKQTLTVRDTQHEYIFEER